MSFEFPLIGRSDELAQVRNALLNRRHLVILAPTGFGKSRLLEAASESLPDLAPVRIKCPLQPHELLVGLARELLQEGHKSLTGILTCGVEAVPRQTSIHLRGVLWKSLTLEPRTLILEDIHGASAPIYRFLKPLYYTDGVSIVATAHSVEGLGFLQRLFWDPRIRLDLKPLRDQDARQLASLAADRFVLPVEIDRAELQDRVVEAASGNPGRIVEMYRLAAESRYRRGDYVKMALIRIDLAARFSG